MNLFHVEVPDANTTYYLDLYSKHSYLSKSHKAKHIETLSLNGTNLKRLTAENFKEMTGLGFDI